MAERRAGDETEAAILMKRINGLVKHLARLVSRKQLKKSMGAMALIAGLGFGHQAQAQLFAPPVTNPFGLADTVAASLPSLVDIDADGDLDVVLASVGYADIDSRYAKNTGTATAPQFAKPVTGQYGLPTSTFLFNLEFADLDGDGDLDILSSEYTGMFMYLQNTGTAAMPQFANGNGNPFGLASTGGFMFNCMGDLDGDGDIDILVIDDSGDMLYYQNTGTSTMPAFAAPTTNPFGLTALPSLGKPELVDLDNDGDLDLLTGETGGIVRYFKNTGSATAPLFAPQVVDPFGIQPTNGFACITTGDLDGDGDIDILIGENDADIKFYENVSKRFGLDELNNVAFSLYPNPTTNTVQIASATEAIVTVDVLNVSGQCLAQIAFSGQPIDLRDYPAGLYFIRVITENGNVGVQQVAKQ